MHYWYSNIPGSHLNTNQEKLMAEKKPLVMVAKDARDAAKKLNEYVEKGGYKFDFGISTEYVVTVSKNSDGSKKEEKEKRFRFTGFVHTYVGQELDSLNLVRADLKKIKKEREEMNRTLNVMNKSAFAPISIFLLIIAIVTLTFGILTLSHILPLPKEQIGIAIFLVIFGTLALAGSILLAVFRWKKKRELNAIRGKIEKDDMELQARETELDNKVPQWYKDALWKAEGNFIKNASQRFELKP